jgi:two-component system chemotaxis sensor kinase CheA
MIERAADTEVVQYRGEIMPLVRLPISVSHSTPPSDSIKVVVSNQGGQKVGVIVDAILDVVRRPDDICGQRAGAVGSVVIDQRITDIVDLSSLISTKD